MDLEKKVTRTLFVKLVSYRCLFELLWLNYSEDVPFPARGRSWSMITKIMSKYTSLTTCAGRLHEKGNSIEIQLFSVSCFFLVDSFQETTDLFFQVLSILKSRIFLLLTYDLNNHFKLFIIMYRK
jgi:hypothetical protein